MGQTSYYFFVQPITKYGEASIYPSLLDIIAMMGEIVFEPMCALNRIILNELNY
jgi:hypothetical protein